MDWAQPTEQMIAALALARRCSKRGGLSEIQVAEWVILAAESLWFHQAAAWAEEAPPEVEEKSRLLFSQGCKTIVDIVSLGYDAEARMWWPLRKLWETEDQRAMGSLVLMDALTLVKRLPNVGTAYPGGTVGFPVVSAGFSIFGSIILGPRWERQYEAMMSAMQEAARLGGGLRGGRQA